MVLTDRYTSIISNEFSNFLGISFWYKINVYYCQLSSK
jgi:hypothetical protein